jgi:hypothetical protein
MCLQRVYGIGGRGRPSHVLASTKIMVSTPHLLTGVEFEDFDYHGGIGEN